MIATRKKELEAVLSLIRMEFGSDDPGESDVNCIEISAAMDHIRAAIAELDECPHREENMPAAPNRRIHE